MIIMIIKAEVVIVIIILKVVVLVAFVVQNHEVMLLVYRDGACGVEGQLAMAVSPIQNIHQISRPEDEAEYRVLNSLTAPKFTVGKHTETNVEMGLTYSKNEKQ